MWFRTYVVPKDLICCGPHALEHIKPIPYFNRRLISGLMQMCQCFFNGLGLVEHQPNRLRANIAHGKMRKQRGTFGLNLSHFHLKNVLTHPRLFQHLLYHVEGTETCQSGEVKNFWFQNLFIEMTCQKGIRAVETSDGLHQKKIHVCKLY